jgi:hypothetical protein
MVGSVMVHYMILYKYLLVFMLAPTSASHVLQNSPSYSIT